MAKVCGLFFFPHPEQHGGTPHQDVLNLSDKSDRLGANNMTATATKNLLEQQWHSLSEKEAAQLLHSDLEMGLTIVEAEQQHTRYGSNQLVGKQGKSAWMRFLLQFNQPLLYILLAAGVVTAFLHEWVDAGVIFAVTIINALIDFVQESKANQRDRCLSRVCHY